MSEFLVMNMLRQASDGSLTVISAKANVHWSPLEMNNLPRAKSLSWNSFGIRLCIKIIHTYYAWNKYRRSISYQMRVSIPITSSFTWQATVWKKSPHCRGHLFPGAFEPWWRNCMWSHHIRCPSKANHKFFALKWSKESNMASNCVMINFSCHVLNYLLSWMSTKDMLRIGWGAF